MPPLDPDEARNASAEQLLAHFYRAKAGEVLAASGGSIRRVLQEPVARYRVAHRKLLAAQELVRRALLEEIHRTVLSSPSAVTDFLKAHFAPIDVERFVAVWLDAQHRLLAVDDLFVGTLTQTAVYPREVVRMALKRNAAGVILSHNHPSGIAEPSPADQHLTETLKNALSLVDVKVVDHIVIAHSRSTSFAQRGLL